MKKMTFGELYKEAMESGRLSEPSPEISKNDRTLFWHSESDSYFERFAHQIQETWSTSDGLLADVTGILYHEAMFGLRRVEELCSRENVVDTHGCQRCAPLELQEQVLVMEIPVEVARSATARCTKCLYHSPLEELLHFQAVERMGIFGPRTREEGN